MMKKLQRRVKKKNGREANFKGIVNSVINTFEPLRITSSGIHNFEIFVLVHVNLATCDITVVAYTIINIIIYVQCYVST